MRRFITFEGCEGVGKTTQLRLLKEYCAKKNLNVVFTREPGGSSIAEKIRSIILDPVNSGMTAECEALLYAAARNQHLSEVIIPKLNMGVHVICDRYLDSTYAYQGYARGLGKSFIDMLNKLSISDYIPEYTFFLDLEPNKSFARKSESSMVDRMEKEGIDFHNKVYNGYKELIRLEPSRFIVVDASGTKYETHEVILNALIKINFFE